MCVWCVSLRGRSGTKQEKKPSPRVCLLACWTAVMMMMMMVIAPPQADFSRGAARSSGLFTDACENAEESRNLCF